jgi:hypothetical protein
MKARIWGLFLAAAAVAAGASCNTTTGLPQQVSGERIVVTFENNNTPTGSPSAPLPIDFNPSQPYSVRLEMHRADDSIDTDFNSFVRVSSKPGTVFTVNGGQFGRNVQLQAGVADNVTVSIVAAFGPTRIWAQDVGYVPGSLTSGSTPQCSDGIDNNGNGLVDYPADPGCYASNDDDEGAGTGATGVSPIIYYALPRIADVRGGLTTSGTGTPFPFEQVDIDTGFDPNPDTNPNASTDPFKWDTIVTGLVSDGFFATDLQDGTKNGVTDPQQGLGYGSVFAYTFSAPQKIGVCDRLRLLEGTSSDFFGYTELNFPTWAVEYWDPNVRPCLVPDPLVLAPADWNNSALMFNNESGLVRLLQQGSVTLHVGAHMGAGKPDSSSGYAPSQDANGVWKTNCDLNGDGKVEFSNANEAACANACETDPECTEFSSYLSQSGFTIVVTDGTTTAKAQGNAAAATSFDPVANAGQQLKAFTGLLRYFSGGSQFTIQARCDDDVVADLSKAPLDSSHACVNQNGNNPDQQN